MGTVLSGVRGHAERQRIQRERARGSKDDTGGVEGEWQAADEGARGVGEDSRVVGESGERRRRAHARWGRVPARGRTIRVTQRQSCKERRRAHAGRGRVHAQQGRVHVALVSAHAEWWRSPVEDGETHIRPVLRPATRTFWNVRIPKSPAAYRVNTVGRTPYIPAGRVVRTFTISARERPEESVQGFFKKKDYQGVEPPAQRNRRPSAGYSECYNRCAKDLY